MSNVPVISEPDGLTSMRVRLHAYVIGNLKREAKVRGVTVSEIVEEACQLWLAHALVQQPAPVPSVTGWQCGVCGTWVGLSQMHSCGGMAIYPLPARSCPTCGAPWWDGHECVNGTVYLPHTWS